MGDEYLNDVADQLKGMDEAARKEAAEMAKKAEEMDKALSGYRSNTAFFIKTMSIIAIIFAAFHFYTGGFGMFTAIRQRAIHLMFALWICFIKYSANKNKGPNKEPVLPYVYLGIILYGLIAIPLISKVWNNHHNFGVEAAIIVVIAAIMFVARKLTLKQRIKENLASENRPMWYDYLFMLAGAVGCIYMAINTDLILQRAGFVYTIDQIMGLMLLVCTIEATRRSIGNVLMGIGIFMLLYCRFGFVCGGIFWHPGFTFPMIIRHFVLTDAALWGTPIGVSASYISLFLLLGAALHATGLAELLLKVAKGLVGHFVGGPAKMAVVASSMFAMISGSSTSNVATTGVITIPLMKRTGIPAPLAGATEAAASMGGQVTPPVMGAVAFIMAEFLGISYVKIVVAAALPALLYYVSVFTMIHFESHKIGAWGLKKSEIDPTWKHDLLTKGFLLLPVVLLVYMLVKGYTAMASCFYSFLLAVALSFVRKDTRLTVKKFFGIFDQAGQTLCVVAVPSAIAGFVEGTATLTGLTPSITKVLTDLSNSNMILTLLITMTMCLVLGMGVPTVANYILMTIMTVPTMISVGVMPLAAHLFCFYFGIMSELTPPVAITSYTASAIAGAPFWPTAFNAVRLAAVAYIVPYIFVFNTSLLLGTQPFTPQLFIVIITAALGSLSFAIGMAGFIRRKMFLIERFAICGFAVLLITPDHIQDLIGLAGIAFIVAMQWIYKKNPKNYIPPVKPKEAA
ncbi:MAG: TRAP transporter fused permease subunit [Spirochaetia bacterium]|nr:TRAP transporter fused permease subunit [Spirochaetia bacterium]